MKDKGFTLVELLAAMVILALLIFVGTMTVSNIFDNTKDNYYKSLENTLSIAGNEYFNDNREDRPVDDYNFVDMETLVNHEYMEELKTYDGKDKCKSETGVYIYNEGNDNGYEVCLVCGEYKSEGVYCNGKKSGTIHITGNINDKNGPSYNPLLSYSGTKWINASNIWIHFSLIDEGINVSKYTIYNANGNSKVGDCTATGNKCSMRFDKTGSYYVEAFDGNNKVGNRKYFNVKLDNTPPTMDLKNLGTEFFLDNDSIVYDYENEVINVNDDNGYKEVKYTLIRYNPSGNEDIARDKDIKDADFKIHESLQSGKYDLYITVTDFAGNKATQRNTHITFYIKYNVDLQYFDNKDNKHDAGTIKVYTYGKYTNLPDRVNVNSNPQEVSWYLNANMVGNITTTESQVEKTGYHVLYGKEAKFKSSFKITCNDITYDTNYHQLASIPSEEKGKYRLLVYYDNKLMANEARDARTYTIIAMLNTEYTWADGTTKAKSKQCTIKTKQVDKPTCDNKTYTSGELQIVKPVDINGNYSVYAVENAYSLGKRPTGINAGNYSFKASLNGNKNYTWDGGSDFSPSSLTCEIYRKKLGLSRGDVKCNDPSELVFMSNIGIARLLDQSVEDSIMGSDEDDLIGVPHDAISVDGASFSKIDGYNTQDYDVYYAVGRPLSQSGMSDVGFDVGNGNEPLVSIKPKGAGPAGTYDVRLHIESPNYEWADGSRGDIVVQCTITPAKITIDWDTKTKYEWDGTTSYPPTPTVDVRANHDGDVMTLSNTQEKGLGKHTSTAKCISSTWGCKNYEITNTTKEYEIVDTKAPTCDSVSVSRDGTITAKASDKYGFNADGTTKTKTKTQGAKTKTNKVGFTDYSGNTGYCEIFVYYGSDADKCGTWDCCSYGNYHCTGTADKDTTACSDRTYKDCAGTGCSWTGYNWQCSKCANTCYYSK